MHWADADQLTTRTSPSMSWSAMRLLIWSTDAVMLYGVAGLGARGSRRRRAIKRGVVAFAIASQVIATPRQA
jgi:hypothetical protein